MDLEAMARKGDFIFPKSPKLETRHRTEIRGLEDGEDIFCWLDAYL